MQFYPFIAARADTGRALPLARVTVYLSGTATLATLKDGAGAALTNPFIAGVTGLAGFAAANGAYDVQITSADGAYSAPLITGVQLYDLAGIDGQVASANAAAGRAAQAALALTQRVGTAAAALLAGEPGLAIDASTDLTSRAVASVGGGHDFDGDLRSWLPASVFTKPKQVIDATGATVWSPHNIVYATAALNDGGNWVKSGIAIVDAISTPAGASASKLTATAASANVRQDVSVGGGNVGDPLTCAVIASAAAGHVLELKIDGNAAFFDLSTGMVSNVAAGLTAAMSARDVDGTALPAGEYLCSLSGAWASGSATMRIGVVDAAGAEAVTAGASLYVRQPRASYGTRVLGFLARAGYPAAMPVGIPYDWSRGERRILIDATDAFSLTSAMMAAPGTVYLEADVEPAGNITTPPLFEVGNGSAVSFVQLDRSGNAYPDPYLSLTVINGATTFSLLGTVAGTSKGKTLAVALRLQPGQIMAAVNGDLSTSIYSDVPAFDHLSLAGAGGQVGCRLYLKTLVALTRVLSDRELAAFRDAQRLHPTVRSSAVILPHKSDFATDHGTRSREPSITLLGETADRAYLLATAHQKWGETEETYGPEEPARIRYRTFEVDRSGAIVAASAIGVFDQPAGWSQGLGHMLGRCGVKLRTGARKGQTLCLWAVLTSADQTFGPNGTTNPHSIYGRYITDNARGPLPARFEVFTTPQIQAIDPTARYIITDPSGSIVEFPADSPWPGRVVFAAYTDDTHNRSFWSDQQGAAGSWQASPVMPQIAGFGQNECNLVLLPNNQLLCINRIVSTTGGGEPANKRTANLSTDGGQTWGPAIDMSATFTGAQVSGGITQTDPAGTFGVMGRVAYARSIALPGISRTASLVSYYTDPSMAPLREFYAQAPLVGCGYSSLVSLFGGAFYALAVEIATKSGDFNGVLGSSTWLKIIKPPA